MLYRFILLFLSLSSAPAFSESMDLIDARQVSGFTRMEDAFDNSCTLRQSGELIWTLKQGRTESGGWIRESEFRELLSPGQRQEIFALILEAADGPFLSSPAVCDTGDFIIRATPKKGSSYVVVEIRDCQQSTLNLNPSAKRIEDWVQTHCHWRR